MQKFIQALLAVSIVSLSSLQTFAAGVDGQTVERVRVYQDKLYIRFEQPINAPAACATTNNEIFVMLPQDGNHGVNLYSTAMTALLTKKPVITWCPDQCLSQWSDKFTMCTELGLKQK